MKITIDTEKDSKEEIKETIELLQRIMGSDNRKTELPKPVSTAKQAETIQIQPLEKHDNKKSISRLIEESITDTDVEDEKERRENVQKEIDGEALLNKIAKKKIATKETEEVPEGVPKSVKEAYELADDLEPY